MVYSQLGITQSVLDGTADEKTMLNYTNRTVEPIISAIVDELKRKFLTKTARSQLQSIVYFRDPFRLVPVNDIAEIADKFTRNEIMTSNEIRQIVGMQPSKDPKADELVNSNISQAKQDIPQTSNATEVNARVNDMYLNTSTGNTYKCTVAGNATNAKWVYAGNIKGVQGDKGNTGATGNGISKADITYASSSSNTSAPTSGWQNTPPSVSPGQYLWTKTVFTYTNGGTATQYSVAKQGNTGAAGADAITVSITSSNGTVFKNNSGSTVLTAHVYKGAVEQTVADNGTVSGLGTIKWYKVGSDTAVATAKTLTVSANDVDNTQAYTCQLEG